MLKKVLPIAKITQVSGFHGEVRLRPFSRYFDDYVETRDLSIGFEEDISHDIKLSKSVGQGKNRRFQFSGFHSRDAAETLVGQILFAHSIEGDNADRISKDLLGYKVITEKGDLVGELADILWLPANDVYVIRQSDMEKLIPVIDEIIVGIDHSLSIIVISPMDGLL